jgi:hypothetical protein
MIPRLVFVEDSKITRQITTASSSHKIAKIVVIMPKCQLLLEKKNSSHNYVLVVQSAKNAFKDILL